MRVVLVEDNEMLARAVEAAFRDLGYALDWLANGVDADVYLATEGADVAIIDVNLPGMSGFELVAAMRRRHDQTPILLLTARVETKDRVAGLDAGADDYLVKPFDMSELSARVRALARRRPELKPTEERIGLAIYHRAARRLSGPDGTIDLPRRELALLEHLLDHRGRIVPKEEIGDALYGVGAPVDLNAVELLVSRLRRKLKATGATIITARGLGYMLDTRDPARC
ncbi:MAG: response regulator transcription factor [Pseudomonadota bacterium]